ncbi:MAG: hypothetical protein AAF230_09775 [Pseudomonadota bacterium]
MSADKVGISEERGRAVRALAVGNPKEWQEQGHVLPTEGLAFVGFHEVTEVTLDYLQPAIVFSPVLANGFDCIDLAMALHKLGYSGEYRAIAIGYPKPAVIEREVKQMCPQLDFVIIDKL